jgi:tetratricopeptide (TPR) repeat protein
MASSLSQGIEAAKSGQMEQALAHLKDAIVEEPENADVWVWLAAIIEDEDKQTIFLKKALEIDPNNKPAQRGLAFIERKKNIPPKPGEKLSDYTKPIGVFKAEPAKFSMESTPQPPAESAPAAEVAEPAQPTAELVSPPITEASPNRASTAAQSTSSASTASAPSRKAWVDILIYGVILMAFVVIGILIGTTLLNVDIPFLTKPTPVLSMLPPSEGVFVLENGQYAEMKLSLNAPQTEDGIPLTSQTQPQVVINNQVIKLERLQFVDEEGKPVAFTTVPAENGTAILSPQEALDPGRYCLVFNLNADRGEALYWCLQVE